MILIFFSFESIEIAYTDAIDTNQHIVVSEQTPAVFEVIKQGVKIQKFLDRIANIKEHQMTEQNNSSALQSPVFVCLTGKPKKQTQPIFHLLSPKFQKHLLYIKNDRGEFGDFTFNRAVLIQNSICYGQGYAQLRQKEELRLAVLSVFSGEPNIQCIFIEKHVNQLKELKKQGYSHLVADFQEQTFFNVFKQAQYMAISQQQFQASQLAKQSITKHPFAQQYLKNLIKVHKDTSLKLILPFNLQNLSINGFLHELYRETIYYNISPKSWAPHQRSKQISSYIFHNTSNSQLYLARASTTKELSNEQDFEIKILAYYLSFIINPSSYTLSHDRLSSLMKFCKIKLYENKKAYFDVRPYIEGLSTINQLVGSSNDVLSIFQNGYYGDLKVIGVGSILLTALLLNDNLSVKSLSEQTTLLGIKPMQNQLFFMTKDVLENYKGDLYLCRIDFHKTLGLSNYKLINDEFILSYREIPLKLRVQDLHPNILNEMQQIIYQLSEQKLRMVKSLVLYYRWNTKLATYYDVFTHRLRIIGQVVGQLTQYYPSERNSLLREFPMLSCLLLDQNYSYFMVPSKNLYSPTEYSYEAMSQTKKQAQNPHLAYISKTCSFAIYNISFPIHSFLQWVKSTNRYQIIEYISMINHSFQEYIIMDKRLKLLTTNEKKNVILVVDHAELCETLINRPKSIKTVMIFRLRKISDIEDVGMISSEPEKRNNLRESDDELIKILVREGLKQFSQQNQFSLYDWIFKSYIKIKCHLYDLNYNTALQFSQILHQAICTNRHRLKEIKENHPKLYVYLYTLPIIKQGQKIVYNYRFFEYLHAYQLFDKILNKKWSCTLQTYQNSSVVAWRSIIGEELAVKVIRSVMEYLQQLQKVQMQSNQIRESNNDCLELIRSLTQTTNKDNEHLLPYSLYYEIFVEQIHVHNYTKIKTILMNQQYLVVQDYLSIQISAFQHNQTIILNKGENQNIICLSLQSNFLYFLAQKQNQDAFLLQKIRIVDEENFLYAIEASIMVKHFTISDLLKNQPKAVHLKIANNSIFLIFQYLHKLVVANISSQHSEQIALKEYFFQQQIMRVIVTVNKANEPYLICITTHQLYTLIIADILQEQPQLLKELHFCINENTRITSIKDKEFDTQIIIFLKNQLEILSIAARETTKIRRIQLTKPIKAVSIYQNLLFVFHESDDSLYIYKLLEAGCQRLWRYYWTDPNSTELYVRGDIISLKGGSYLKKIKLRNLQTLMNLMSS